MSESPHRVPERIPVLAYSTFLNKLRPYKRSLYALQHISILSEQEVFSMCLCFCAMSPTEPRNDWTDFDKLFLISAFLGADMPFSWAERCSTSSSRKGKKWLFLASFRWFSTFWSNLLWKVYPILIKPGIQGMLGAPVFVGVLVFICDASLARSWPNLTKFRQVKKNCLK